MAVICTGFPITFVRNPDYSQHHTGRAKDIPGEVQMAYASLYYCLSSPIVSRVKGLWHLSVSHMSYAHWFPAAQKEL